MTNETTFENVQLLDKVFNIGLGWGTVIQYTVKNGKTSTFWVVFKESGQEVHFTASGNVITNSFIASNQTLFWDEVKIVAPVRPVPKPVAPPVDTLVTVWIYPDCKCKRYSTGKFAPDGRLLVFNDGATSKSASAPTKVFAADNWEVAD